MPSDKAIIIASMWIGVGIACIGSPGAAVFFLLLPLVMTMME